MKRRILVIAMSVLIIINSFVSIFGYSDDRILTDPVINTYTGRLEATDMIRNANFTDIPMDYWAREAIARTVALNLVKGYGAEYKPDEPVTNQEAIAYAIRATNQEAAAQAAGVALQATFPANSSVKDLWSLGYLQLALGMEVITQAQYNDALAADQTILDPAVNFIRGAEVTREQAADWLVKTIESVTPNAFQLANTQQSIYQYSDWESISPTMVASVEKLSMDGIMKGSNGNFNPKEKVTRADMAQILRNMDSIYNNIMLYTKKTGTIGAVIEEDNKTTGGTGKATKIYIRTSDGTVDVIKYEAAINSSPQPQVKDAVVYSSSEISGLNILKEDEQIEYLVEPATNTILYVQKTGGAIETQVEGVLDNINQTDKSITIRDKKGNKTTYKLMEGIIRNNTADQPCIYMDLHERLISTLPTGSSLKLTIKNNIVIVLNYMGEPEIRSELRGIVTENNPQLGYITVIDNERKEITKNYYQNTVKVEKQQYYDVMDEIGYIDSVFPNFEYDPRDTFIDDIEAGDIVFITLDPSDSQLISAVSAATNYTMKYGKVKQTQRASDNYISILMEFENKQTEWIDVPNDIFISKYAQPAQLTDILAGDWIKILVNEAIVSPGYTIQSAKEITIEGSERYVTNIYKSQLSGINPVQQQILLKNVETLGKTGWSDYQQIKAISINNSSGVEYYYNDKRISLDFAVQKLKNGYEAYVATETSFGGEKAVKVSFRNSRDELLKTDNIIYADGNGTIGTTNKSNITTDSGTIVVRHGRLTEGINVMVPDYATVSLNGENMAAVVSIEDTPNTTGLMIARGRIKSINEGKSFQVQSMSLLNDTKWSYTPIQRVFTIDYDTKFYDTTGWVNQSTFLDYTDQTKIDKVYTIVTDGSRAIQVIDNPYSTKAIRGTIYAIEENVVKIKDTYLHNVKTGAWTSVSDKNSALNITIPNNYIIAKDNQTTGLSSLKVGNQIRVMTNILTEKPLETDTINGYITFIEK